ncbi:uncharacterized protein LOC129592817 [Paramacrobiotus metropolitanus]|uniref:uncharacterized protein LOC129592817 n=1 Tax=Paramacrobiotus metropolitanus TaxID=2943436 RepID=UPI0024465097|nr:uncharacterized protein LOC129592817 [Paramacrobiotus metropolitanus]
MTEYSGQNQNESRHQASDASGSSWLTYALDTTVATASIPQNSSYSHDGIYSAAQIDTVNYIFAWMYVCLLVLCTVGNGLNLTVLLRSVKTWRMSACHYMIATAVADLGSLWFALPFFLHLLSRGQTEYTPSVAFGIVPWMDDASMWLSDWILVMFSWERLLVILCPFHFRSLQRVTVARIAILILLVLSLSFNMVNFVVNYEDPHNHMIGARYGFDSDGSLSWIRQWFAFHAKAMIIVRLLTFLLILIPNCILIGFLAYYRQTEINTMRVTPNARKESCVSPTRSAQNSINVILLSSAALFLITRAPQTFQMCAVAANSKIGLYNADDSVTHITDDFINLAVLIGYTMNFYVYLLTERQYRERFMAVVVRPLFSCCVRTLPWHDEESYGVEECSPTASATAV